MTKNITLIRGDDTNFLNQTLLIVSFKTLLNLDGYKLRLTVENPTNIIKTYEVQQNAIQIDFNKIDSSTFSIGEHRANLKLIDTLGRVKTIYLFTITVQNEFEVNIPNINEYEIEIELDTDGINKYKNYEFLINKPRINGIELIGDLDLNDIGLTEIDDKINLHNNNIDSHQDIRNELEYFELNYATNEKVNTKADTEYLQQELELKADKSDLNIKANISDIPVKVSQLVNDEGYLTEHQDISNKADIDYVNSLIELKSDKTTTYTKVEIDTIVEDLQDEINNKQDKGEYITKTELDSKGYITDVSDKADKDNTYTKDEIDIIVGNIETLLQEV